MISQTAEYALRAVLYLAQRDDRAPIRVGEVAQELGVPSNYLSKTLHALARTGVLHSTRGPHGGFRLAVPPRRLSLLRIVSPFDDIGARRECLLGQAQCSDIRACAAHAAWKEVSERVTHFFHTTTVADLLAGREMPASPTQTS